MSRYSEIRRGIQIARADKQAMLEMSGRYWETATFHEDGSISANPFWRFAAWAFAIVVGFLAPPIFTVRGRAWRRTMTSIK